MSNFLLRTSTNGIIKAIEDNLFSYISNIGNLPNSDVHIESKIKWVTTDIPHLLFNNIIGAQIESESLDVTIQSIIKAKSRGVPVLLWTFPSQPTSLEEHLEKHGFINEGPIPGMVIDLTNLNGKISLPVGLNIKRVQDNKTMKQWINIFAQGFDLPSLVFEATYNFLSYADPNTTLLYLGSMNNKPVATSLLNLAGGVAGIYNVATIPEARRQGVGTALTHTALQDACIRGYKVGVLEATKMGVPIYQSLGFQEYCKIGVHVWSPEYK